MNWSHDLESALQQARAGSKFVMLDIFNPT